MNVLSLCDGMSCGQIALTELGIKIDKYFASEIDKIAIQTTQTNFPKTIQIGDLTKINTTLLKTLPKIDLVLFGSPCRSISRASQGRKHNGVDYNNGLQGISGLFVNCVDILNWIKKNNNPNVYFLSENVVNAKHNNDIQYMSDYIGVEPILINSKYFSAQDRERYYWTNIPLDSIPTEESPLVLKDIMETNVDSKYYYDKPFEFYGYDKRMIARVHLYEKGFLQIEKVCNPNFKSYTLVSCRGGNHQIKTYQNGKCRKLTPLEYQRLQNIPTWYKMDLSDIHIYNMCGDGWNIETIKFIFKHLKEKC